MGPPARWASAPGIAWSCRCDGVDPGHFWGVTSGAAPKCHFEATDALARLVWRGKDSQLRRERPLVWVPVSICHPLPSLGIQKVQLYWRVEHPWARLTAVSLSGAEGLPASPRRLLQEAACPRSAFSKIRLSVQPDSGRRDKPLQSLGLPATSWQTGRSRDPSKT